jgi:hypothetical protein
MLGATCLQSPHSPRNPSPGRFEATIWVSSTVKDLVAGSDLAVDAMGRFTLKGVPDEWSLYQVS